MIRAIVGRGQFEDGMSEELRFHIDEYTEELRRAGRSSRGGGQAGASGVRQRREHQGRLPRGARAARDRRPAA